MRVYRTFWEGCLFHLGWEKAWCRHHVVKGMLVTRQQPRKDRRTLWMGDASGKVCWLSCHMPSWSCISLKIRQSEIQLPDLMSGQVVCKSELVAFQQNCDILKYCHRSVTLWHITTDWWYCNILPKNVTMWQRGKEANWPTHLHGRSPEAVASCFLLRLAAGGRGQEKWG